jgi:N-acyl-D-aspartate/D-glutamate deacylase
MTHYDLIIRGGRVIDGTGAPGRDADLGLSAGKIAKIGDLGEASGRVIDAHGKIVAPGIMDIHTHYDAPLHWDPYVTSSSWHGVTSVVMGNCGFGYAPCRPSDRDRYMMMMVRTEQIPYEAQSRALKWNWETFPEWMEALRALPKGVNVGMYLPMNPLLIYLKGAEAKTRATTEAERAKMRDLLHEAMDAGACGFSFSHVGEGNGHVDFDGSPVPTDVMDPEDAYCLASVLRERNEGVIQSAVQLRLESRPEISETLARISGRPVLHNLIGVFEAPENPSPTELRLARQWRETLDWADALQRQGLKIYLQGGGSRAWIEFQAEAMTLFNNLPVFQDFVACKTTDERMALAANPDWRRRARETYRRENFVMQGGGLEIYVVANVGGEPGTAAYEGRSLLEIAEESGRHVVDVYFDILLATRMQVSFMLDQTASRNGEKMAIMLRHPRVIPGISDGGAHVKMFVGSNYGVDMLNWMVKEEGRLTLEETHEILSWRPAQMFGFKDRGALLEGYAADIMIYDYEDLGFDRKYRIAHDLPGGDWRQTLPARGISHVIVNGEVTVEHGDVTGAVPGQILTNTRAA